MLRVIEKATRQPITPMQPPSQAAIAGHRLNRFKQKILDTLAAQELSFFQEVVGQIEQEQDISAGDIAAALAYLMQRDRPLQLPAEADVKPVHPKPADEARDRAEPEARPSRQRERPREPVDFEVMRYRLDVGHQHGATPQNIVGAIANEAGIESRYIGRIEIHDDYSTVDLPAGMPEEIFQHLKKVRVRQCPLNISRLDGPRPERSRAGPKPEGARAKPAGDEGQPSARKPGPRRAAKAPVGS